MPDELFKIECDLSCGFSVQSHDEAEAVAIVLDHARTVHQKPDLTAAQVQAMVKVVLRT